MVYLVSGLSFIESNAEKLLRGVKIHCTTSIAIVLPGMVELAKTNGLSVVFPEAVKEILSYILTCRKKFLKKEGLVGQHCYPSLLSYLEALPPSFAITREDISSNLSGDGSLFQSPSATAKAFMVTGRQECLIYLQSLAQRCPSGVPQTYPMDEDLIKLCVTNQLEKLGLSQYFVGEIEETLAQIYGNFIDRKSWVKPYYMIASQLHKDALAFQLLRMHGYKVSPSSFCWFLRDKEIRGCMEKHPEHYACAMMNVYRATNVMFCGEYQLEEARSFAAKQLEKMTFAGDRDHQSQIEHELNLSWLARLDHLEHRMWIEEDDANALWKGKISYNRISCVCNDELLQLAVKNYEFRQSIYTNELKELKRWSEDLGLRSMGFGREKTIYCYFAVAAAASSLPHDSCVTSLVAKSAIIITVADDFFDMKASLAELEHLIDAIGRWDSGGLSSHSKVIFDALDDLVREVAQRYRQQHGADITKSLRELWYETFISRLEEAKWSRNGQTPSIDDYIKIGTISIAVHTLVLPASCFLKPTLPKDKLRPPHYETITKLLMVICRLLNDIQSYQEKPEGKVNSVLINLIENPELDVEDSIAFVREIIRNKKKEFMEHVVMDEICYWPKTSKQFHLSCLKVFQMFFNSSNSYDSNTDLLEDINKAIYLPLSRSLKKKEHLKVNNAVHAGLNKKYATIINSNRKRCFKPNCLNVADDHRAPQFALRNAIYGIAPKIVGGFI